MTCKQLGGPCDHQLRGDRADEVIKAQDRHLKDMVASGDDAHTSAMQAMKGRWKHPISGMGNQRRSYELAEGDTLNEHALKNLVRAAIEHNRCK